MLIYVQVLDLTVLRISILFEVKDFLSDHKWHCLVHQFRLTASEELELHCLLFVSPMTLLLAFHAMIASYLRRTAMAVQVHFCLCASAIVGRQTNDPLPEPSIMRT